MGGRAVHFGAGALGRGLVVPHLVEAGWSVTLVDPVPELVDALRRQNGYKLAIGEAGGSRELQVHVAGVLHPVHDAASLRAALAEATLVTTAVRKENLPGVAKLLVADWAFSGTGEAALVGCENVERVDDMLAGALREAGLPPERLARLRIPRTVVDRICASDWPASTTIRTESYGELAASLGGAAIPGVQGVARIDAVFDRKRYLVNTLADAAAILGRAKGYGLLSEAFADAALLAELDPLVEALLRHLVLRHGFAPADLRAYLALSRQRLANRFIPRQLTTVARDIRRKMLPGERFAAPLIDLIHRGEVIDLAVAVLGRIARLGAALDSPPDQPAFGPDELRRLGTAAADSATIALYSHLAIAMEKVAPPRFTG